MNRNILTKSKSTKPKQFKLTPEQKRMRQCVATFQKYVATYDDQAQYDSYQERTYLDDMLYGLGLSFMKLKPADFKYASGFDRFKQYLREHLK